MLIQTIITREQNQICPEAAKISSERMDEVFAIGNVLYIESVQIETGSASMAAAVRDALANLFVAVGRVVNEKTMEPVLLILNTLKNLVSNLHSALLIEESDTIRLDKYIYRIEMLLAAVVQASCKHLYATNF